MHKLYVLLTILCLLPLLTTGCMNPTQAALVEEEEEEALTASGTIRAAEIRIASEFGGRIQAIVVETGAAVVAGDVLVMMDATPWQLQLTPAEAAVIAARADLAVVAEGVHPAKIAAARARVVLAEVQRDGAYTTWQNALAVVDAPQVIDTQIVEAQGQLELAAQGVEMGEAQLDREKMLCGIHAAGTLERDIADKQVLAAQEALAAALADEKMVQALYYQLWGIRNNPLGFIAQANAAEGQYHLAEQAIVVAQAQLEALLVGPSAEEIAVAEATVRQAKAEANVLRLKIERSTLTSPSDGVIIAQSARSGELVAPSAIILTLADLSEVTLEVYVPEGHIGHVILGQSVSVTVDSFPGRVFAGQVIKIRDQPEFTPRNVATAEDRLNTFYGVEIRILNPDGALKPGMPADAQF